MTGSTTPSFRGLRVLSFESRRAKEMAALISAHGGQPIVAPALREVPLESNAAVMRFAGSLMRGEFDIVVFLTGVGAREVVKAASPRYTAEALSRALASTKVVARGPKPLAVLRELGVPVWVSVPEPNTWRELLSVMEGQATEQPLGGARVAVQEYGVSNTEFLDALRSRGAIVTTVPVYRWMLPEDVGPLKEAIEKLVEGVVDVVLFTTSVQVAHLWQVARQVGADSQLPLAFERVVIGSIGPTTSQELNRRGLTPDLESEHPKMGILVRGLAERSTELLRKKRSGV